MTLLKILLNIKQILVKDEGERFGLKSFKGLGSSYAINALEEKIQALESEAEKKLKEKIDKRNLLAAAKIDQMTRDANLTIQQHISHTAIETAVTIIKKKLDKDEKKHLITQSITELSSIFKN